ncbi:MAG: STAS/SEC14 domain-containing protein [Anaerolineaceae bacterium]|nr:STAS/SEC14 domain-containing protein [Anaerolineaceae bacterium]
MVTSRLEGNIVYLEMEGVFNAKELIAETAKWIDREDEFIGYLCDMNKITKHPAMEQRKAEAQARKDNPKPRALVGSSEALSRFINIYMRFTKAQGTKHFTNYEDAKAWLQSQA